MITGSLIAIIGLVGLTNIITRSYVLQPLREMVPSDALKYMVSCPMCMGFWVGVLYFCIFMPTDTSFSFCITLFETIMYGGLISVCSATMVLLLDYVAFKKTALIDEISHINSQMHVNQTDNDNTNE